LNSVPNRLGLTGHTDATPYTGSSGRTNWDLSADRANAARRGLEAAGLSTDKTARVVGLSSSVLFNKLNPRDPINRRISIIVMTHQAEEDADPRTSSERPASSRGIRLHPSLSRDGSRFTRFTLSHGCLRVRICGGHSSASCVLRHIHPAQADGALGVVDRLSVNLGGRRQICGLRHASNREKREISGPDGGHVDVSI
jgi:OmpA family